MKSFIKVWGIIAMVAVIGLMGGCSADPDPEDRVTITITNLPTQYNGKYATIFISESRTDFSKVIAASFAKQISNKMAPSLEMFQWKDSAISDKGFGKEGSYFICVAITENDMSTTANGAHITAGTQKVNKGGNTYAAYTVPGASGSIDWQPTFPISEEPIPPATFFGTYTASGYTPAGHTPPVTETVVFTEAKFDISDNLTTPNDYLNFSITKWENIATADIPSNFRTDYPNGYKFTGKITAQRGYVPSGQTAPGVANGGTFTVTDVNSTICHMYIYTQGTTTADFKFVRSVFSKPGEDKKDVITIQGGSDTNPRVYSHSN